MSVITPAGYVSGPARSRVTDSRRRAGLTPFSLQKAGEQSGPAAVCETTGVSLLGLQEEGGSPDGDAEKRGFAWAEDTLDVLRQVQIALLRGEPVEAVLSGLDELCRQAPQSVSPRLAAVIRSIRVRAAVETARRKTAPSEEKPAEQR